MNEPLTYSIDETARLLGVSRSTVYRLLRDGKITANKLGPRLVVISASSVREMLEGLPKATYRPRAA